MVRPGLRCCRLSTVQPSQAVQQWTGLVWERGGSAAVWSAASMLATVTIPFCSSDTSCLACHGRPLSSLSLSMALSHKLCSGDHVFPMLQETIDGNLAARAFGLMQVLDSPAMQGRRGERSRQRLDLALLSFLQNFRKVYIGEHVMHASKVLQGLSA